MATRPMFGSVHFTLDTGKKAGPFQAVFTLESHEDDNHLDVTKGGKDYPTPLDFKKGKVKEITFSPNIGRPVSWLSWEYLNNGPWKVDRFMHLE